MAQSPYDSYKQYKKDRENGVSDDVNTITGGSDKAAADYASAVTAAYDVAKQQEAASAAAQKEALSQQYRSSFDKNELQQRINERQLRERMSRLGLSDSGLNRSQQAAVQLQRANADQAVMQQKTAAANAITQQMRSNQSALEQQKQQAIANARYDMQGKKQDYLYSLLNAANERNASLATAYYNGELDRYAADKSDSYNRYKTDRDNSLTLLNLIENMVPESVRTDKNAYRNYVLELLELFRSKGY